MTQYTVWIVSPPNYSHSKCFTEVAECLNAAIKALGHQCSVVTSSFECRGVTIILGAHLMTKCALEPWIMPRDMVIYNLEQITERSPWMTKDYLELLSGEYESTHLKVGRRFEVWDYCQSNVDKLKVLGIEAKLVPVGYMPVLTRIESCPEPDIDVLHIGSLNDRRTEILQTLESKGLRVKHVFDYYGVARDALAARSKIILNMHFYPSKTFEIVRCSYMYANRKCVVSEIGNDEALEMPFMETGGLTIYDNLVERCRYFLADDGAREACGAKGFEIMAKMDQAEYLRGVL